MEKSISGTSKTTIIAFWRSGKMVEGDCIMKDDGALEAGDALESKRARHVLIY